MTKNKADSRSVHTDALETLGTIIDHTAKRDAIHLAVEPVIAGCTLRPGEPVFLNADGTANNDDGEGHVGIVDPFLTQKVKKGQRFWLVVMPRRITSLRHVWEHPEFPPSELANASADAQASEFYAAARERAKQAIQREADRLGVRFAELISNATLWVQSGVHWSEGGRFEGEYINDDFWPNFEIWTGISVPEGDRYSFFSCSC